MLLAKVEAAVMENGDWRRFDRSVGHFVLSQHRRGQASFRHRSQVINRPFHFHYPHKTSRKWVGDCSGSSSLSLNRLSYSTSMSSIPISWQAYCALGSHSQSKHRSSCWSCSSRPRSCVGAYMQQWSPTQLSCLRSHSQTTQSQH